MTVESLFAELEPPEETHSVGTYRCRDNISNLKIRIRTSPVTSNLPSMLSVKGESPSSSDPEKTTSEHRLKEEVVLGWQEKLFSREEFRHYSNSKEEDFEAPMKKKLVCDAKKLRTDGFVPKNRISTKVEGENEEEELDVFNQMTTDPHEEPNVVSLLMREGVRRRGVVRVTGSASQERHTRNIVTSEPSREVQLRNHVVTSPMETMEVRVDLNTEEGGEEHLVVLASLTFTGNNVLTVQPDFSWSGRPYRLEVEGQEVLEYWVENCSSDLDYDSQLRENLVQNEVYARHNQLQQAEVGDNFEMPPAGMFRLHLAGEIESARMFSPGRLYCNFLLDLPQGWTAGEGTVLQGATQVCSTSGDTEGRDRAHFSFPLEADLFFSINSLDADKEVLPSWPQLLIEVVSVDHWGRYRVEGYSHTVLPSNPGSHSITLHTWTPATGSYKARMRRFFIGGTPELEDIRYVGNSDTQGAVLSKLGFQTRASGSLTVKMNLIHQAKAFMLGNTNTRENSRKLSRRVLIDRLTSATLFTSVNTVLEAFRKAREKIVRATEGIDFEKQKISEQKVDLV